MERAGPSARPDRLAVVGVAFRFPGPPGEAFWSALRAGSNLVGTVHESRWPAASFHHPRKSEPGASYTLAGGSLGDLSGFDAAFFGISPREAAQLDPQQRLLLELAWEAFEAGGIRPSSVRGSRAGVYIGFSGSDHSHRVSDDLAAIDAFSMTGVTGSIAANRLSYFFDLRGPSMALDTACSSSLVAFHQARQAILSGEVELAITGAAHVHMHPFPYIGFAQAGMLSKRGLCTPFDADADGYVRSEGAAVVLLKRLEDAIAAGNRIFAVVAGSGVNCDGKTSALTVPSCEAQASLLREVYSRACIDPAEIDYVEAHGTGTAVGDPIEARALGEALGRLRERGSPLRIGSVKSNLGHLETASGMAGLVKAIYCLRDRVIPPSINFNTPNPRIAFDDWNLQVVTESTRLDPRRRLVIGINSFGFGGANAHVILESGTAPQPARPSAGEGAAPFIISARSEEALKTAALRHAEWLRQRRELPFGDLAYSAALHRDWLEHRAIVFGAERDAAADALEAFARGSDVPGVATGRALAKAQGPVFVYSGNGSQWAGMGRRLLAEAPVFRQAVTEVDSHFRRHSEFSILDALQGDDIGRLLEATEHAQPLLFAVQAGLTELLRDWGIKPAAVLGHSVGEIAAAWACGALTLEQAVAVVFGRSAWQAKTRGAGAMTAVALGEQEATALLASFEGRLTLAAINSPAGVTIAGAQRDLEQLETELSRREASFRRLALDYAFHSPAMDAIEQGVRRSLSGLRPSPGSIAFHSAVSGERMPGEALDAAYWWRNIRQPVRFGHAVGKLLDQGTSLFVEIGPHPTLRGYLGECLRSQSVDGRVVATMTRSGDGAEALTEKAFQVVIAGCPVDAARLFPQSGTLVDLPGYPWQRERHVRVATTEAYGLADRPIVHPLLGSRLPASECEWESRLDTCLLPALADHRVGGETLLPAAAFAEMALAAAAQLGGDGACELHDLEIRSPLALDEQHAKSVRFSVDPADGRFAVRSRARLSSDPWQTNATGRLAPCTADSASAPRLTAPSDAKRLSAELHYRLTAAAGLDYGPAFQQVEEAWCDGRAVLATLKSPLPLGGAAPALLHPASLDACFQLLVHALRDGDGASALVPVSIGHLVLLRPRQSARFARIEPTRRGRRSLLADCSLHDAAGETIATLRGVRFRALPPRKPGASLSFLASRSYFKPLGAAAAPLPPLEHLAEACRARLHAPARIEARERYFTQVEPLLEAMLAAFARQALSDAPAVPAERMALAERLREAALDGEFPDARAIWRELLGDYPDHAHEVIALGRVGARLAELLQGGTWSGPPALPAPQFAEAIADLVGEALRALPARRRLRVLALDAGGASGTARMLEKIDAERCDCVVLCADPAVMEERKALAVRYPGTRVCTMDLPPELAEPFDIVIAEQGLAWAREPERVLEHLRSLAASQGLLVLGEQRPSRAAALAQELLRAAGHETAQRNFPPAEHLRAALEQRGFTDCLVLPDVPELDSGSYLLLACAPQRAVRAPASAGNWLLFADREGYSARFAGLLAAALRARGLQVGVRHEPVLDATQEHPAGVVHLLGLGAPLEQQGTRCESLARLVEACIALPSAPAAWVVTASSHSHPAEAPLWGFGRTAINEYPQLALRLADLAAPEAAETMSSLLADALLDADAEDEIILGPDGRYAVRVQVVAPARAAPPGPRSIARLDLCSPGQMKGLCWVRHDLAVPAEDEVEIEVRAAGLNFRDVMFASGQLADEALEDGFAGATLGMELAGTVVSAGARAPGLHPGDAVIAFAPASFATRAVTKAAAVIRKPADWSFEAAATVPAAFLTAYYALHQLARLEEGQRILIHGAAGGVGIAAVQIAQMAGAEIFATAGAEAKRDFLRLLGVEHVLDSRSLAFAGEVMRRTAGQGVDVVLNSLAGEAMSRSLRVLKPFGRFLELGKRDFYEDTRIGLRPFRNNISYFGIDADQLLLERPELTRRLLQELMALFKQGRLKPLPYQAFAAADALEAFRFMQQSKQIGKVVLDFASPPAAPRAPAAPAGSLQLRADATYLVTGGLRGFGLRTAQWLAAKGARHLVLAGRSGAADEEARAAVAALQAGGVSVKVACCDVADRQALEALLGEIRASAAPLRGVVHAAAVIRDGLIRGLGAGQIDAVLAPKVQGAANLDALTREAPLDFFVLYSSATTLFGNPGQASYVAANRYLEVLAESRRAERLPALCVSWGPIGDTGYLARHKQVKDALEARMGGTAIAAAEALAVLEQLLLGDAGSAAVVRLDRGLPRMLAGTVSPKFQPLAARFDHGEHAAGDSASVQRWLEELDDEALGALFTDIVRKEIGDILRLAPEKLEPRQPLQDLGLDSLMGVELVTALEARLGVNVPSMALAEANTIERLVKRVVKELRRGQAAAEPGAATAEQVRLLAARHAREIEPQQVEKIAAALEVKAK